MLKLFLISLVTIFNLSGLAAADEGPARLKDKYGDFPEYVLAQVKEYFEDTENNPVVTLELRTFERYGNDCQDIEIVYDDRTASHIYGVCYLGELFAKLTTLCEAPLFFGGPTSCEKSLQALYQQRTNATYSHSVTSSPGPGD